MTDEEMRKDILTYVKNEYLEDEGDSINADSPLISAGLVDSFSMVSLLMYIRKKYTDIPDDKATPEAFDSVNKIISLIKQYQVKK